MEVAVVLVQLLSQETMLNLAVSRIVAEVAEALAVTGYLNQEASLAVVAVVAMVAHQASLQQLVRFLGAEAAAALRIRARTEAREQMDTQ